MRKIIYLFIVMLLLSGCSAQNEDGVNQTEFSMNESINYKDITYVVNDFELIESEDFEGEMLLVSLTIENTSTKSFEFSPLYFNLIDDKGEEHQYIYSYVNSETALEEQVIYANETVEGTLLFMLNNHSETYDLSFNQRVIVFDNQVFTVNLEK
ncbi:MAG: DUF4352 domain-containing protein [bacterium]